MEPVKIKSDLENKRVYSQYRVLGDDGRDVFKTFSFGALNPDATDEDIYAVVTALNDCSDILDRANVLIKSANILYEDNE